MATVTQIDNTSNTYSGPDFTLKDEFLPYVEFDSEINSYQIGEEKLTLAKDSTGNDESFKLSKYLDAAFRNQQVLLFETVNKKIKIPFKVKEGSSKSWDDDGLLSIRFSEEDASIKLVNTKEFKTKYNSTFNLEIEFTDGLKKEFYIDFYARDNEDDTYSTGELVDVHCGRFKVKKNEACICQDDDWKMLPNMVAESDKVLYSDNTVIPWVKAGTRRECYHYALHQLRVLGYWLKAERWNKTWSGPKELNDHIYQLYIATPVAGMAIGAQKNMFKDSLKYLKKAMKAGTPVMVGLDYNFKNYANDDLITDHFGVITGSGRDKDGKLYFYVTDNAFEDQKFYCNCDRFEIAIPGTDDKNGTRISQLRESKKL